MTEVYRWRGPCGWAALPSPVVMSMAEREALVWELHAHLAGCDLCWAEMVRRARAMCQPELVRPRPVSLP